MPTGPKHYRFIDAQVQGQSGVAEDCRCMIGEDHVQGEVAQSYSVYEAADAWLSSGKDEDYTFGYSEDELMRAAGQD
jgi:hypothetical protein